MTPSQAWNNTTKKRENALPCQIAILCPMRVRQSVPGSPWRHAIDGSINGIENEFINDTQALAMQCSDHSQEQAPRAIIKYH